MQSLDYVIKSWQELTKEELYQLLQLRTEVFVVEQNCPYQDIDGTDQQSCHLLVKESSNPSLLIAYLRFYPSQLDNKSVVAMGRVCTRANNRKQGVSRELMNQALAYIEQKELKTITVSAQAYLEDFYQSLGFKAISELYDEDGIPHIRMIREII